MRFRVVGQRLDEHGDAPGRVALVDHALEGVRVGVVTRALGDRPLDVVLGHARVARLLDGGGERGVTSGIAAAPSRAATWIARASFVKSWPRLASAAPFLCLMEDHLEWPDMGFSLGRYWSQWMKPG